MIWWYTHKIDNILENFIVNYYIRLVELKSSGILNLYNGYQVVKVLNGW